LAFDTVVPDRAPFEKSVTHGVPISLSAPASFGYILFNALLTLTHVPGTTLLSVMRMLSDVKFRRDLLQKVADPVVRSFWQLEFDKYHDRLRMEAIAPIQNKVGQFLE
jgi:hypothetical protein